MSRAVVSLTPTNFGTAAVVSNLVPRNASPTHQGVALGREVSLDDIRLAVSSSLLERSSWGAPVALGDGLSLVARSNGKDRSGDLAVLVDPSSSLWAQLTPAPPRVVDVPGAKKDSGVVDGPRPAELKGAWSAAEPSKLYPFTTPDGEPIVYSVDRMGLVPSELGVTLSPGSMQRGSTPYGEARPHARLDWLPKDE